MTPINPARLLVIHVPSPFLHGIWPIHCLSRRRHQPRRRACHGLRKVAGTMQFVKSPARSLFLYLDRPYPTPVFMALIPGRDLPNFHDPRSLNGQNICVKGLIKNHKGRAAIFR